MEGRASEARCGIRVGFEGRGGRHSPGSDANDRKAGLVFTEVRTTLGRPTGDEDPGLV